MRQFLKLWYREPAPAGNEDFGDFRWGNDRPDDGWEKWSLPIGNGTVGVSVFGRTLTERLQFSEKSLSNSYHQGGQNNFAEVYLDFGHREILDYERSLDLDAALARVSYVHAGVRYEREAFVSYPDQVFALRVTASEPGRLTFGFRPTIPFVDETDGRVRKTGHLHVEGNKAELTGVLTEFGIHYAGLFCLLPQGGQYAARKDRILVEGADSVVLLGALGTNYRLEPRVFLQPDPLRKLSCYPLPLPRLRKTLRAAARKGYGALRAAHVKDHQRLFRRVDLQLGREARPDRPTDEWVRMGQAGQHVPELETLFFVYGRYLLIASSRPGTLPAHLQGAWNRYDHAPWSAGFWHNINVQMNYWPAFPTNLCETFAAYAGYYDAYLPLAQRHADRYIGACHPEQYEKGRNGWIIGTGAWPLDIQGLEVRDGELQGHSGPGTGALTSLLFWDYYRFTGDRHLLRTKVYPALAAMSRFLSKTLVRHGDKELVQYSASPEQRQGGAYYHTTGCAFDQQMVWENHAATLEAARILGIEDDFTARLREQLARLDPVQVGTSGQIKEFREESAYGEIGEYRHRHVSHLVGLYPGGQIHSGTPAWLEAAKKTLALRGDESTGWGMAHRMLLWARAKDGERAYRLYRLLLRTTTYPNLWATHPPFQIDANFGGTAGVAEMLVQSHEGFIDLLPAVPDAWSSGSFRGLLARGGFILDAEWADHRLVYVRVRSRRAGTCRLRLPGIIRPVARPAIAFEHESGTSLVVFRIRAAQSVVFQDGNRGVSPG